MRTVWRFLEKVKVKVTLSCPSLCDPMDYTVHEILQARILKWVAFPFYRDLPNPGIEPRSPTLQEDSLPADFLKVVNIQLWYDPAIPLLGFQRRLSRWCSWQCKRCKRCRLNPWLRKIPWRKAWQPTPVFLPGESQTDEPGRLQSMGLQRVRHNWATEHTQEKLIIFSPNTV